MTREELREHCEKQVEACLHWHKVSGKPLGLMYEEHKLILDLLDQDANKEKRLEELLESLQTANATNTTLIQLVESKQEPCKEMFDDWHEAPSYAMTLEQAREAVHELRKDAVKMKKETCEDARSLAQVFEILGNLMSIPYDLDRPINKDDVSESMDAIRALPPVTPTRKVGKWIKDCETPISINYHCSECGRPIQVFFTDDKDNKKLECYPFCHCGADMRGEEDEEN